MDHPEETEGQNAVLTLDHGEEPVANPWESQAGHAHQETDVGAGAAAGPDTDEAHGLAHTYPTSEPTTTAAPPPLPPHHPPPPVAAVADPRIAPLQAIFPDFDDSLLSSVLDACNGNQEQAVESLLSMSDPEYVSQHREPPSNTMSQTDLDEQLAHRLILEEEENAARSGAPRQGGAGSNVPYQPRQHAPRRQQAPPPQGGGYPVVDPNAGTLGGVNTAQMQEQLSRFAESGKKTLGNIFSKVKQKIQELDQPQKGDPGTDQGVPASQWNQPAVVNDNTDPTPRWTAPASRQAQGYQVGNGPFHPPPAQPQTIPAMSSAGPVIRDRAGPSEPSSSSSPPANIDLSRLNLLPKRPVSLVDSQGVGSSSRRDEDEEDLEYVENPFEDK